MVDNKGAAVVIVIVYGGLLLPTNMFYLRLCLLKLTSWNWISRTLQEHLQIYIFISAFSCSYLLSTLPSGSKSPSLSVIW